MANLIFQYKTGEGTKVDKTFIHTGQRVTYQSDSGYTNFTAVAGNPNQTVPKTYYVLNDDRSQLIMWTGGNGNFTRYAHTNDGLNYTEFNIPNSWGARGVVWHQNQWVSFDDLSAGGFQISTSTDGVNWTIESPIINLTGIKPLDATPQAMVSTGSELVVAADDGGPALIASGNLTTWDCPVCPNGCTIPTIPDNQYLTGMFRTQNSNTFVLGTARSNGAHSVLTSHDGGCSWVARFNISAFETLSQVLSYDGTTMLLTTNDADWHSARSDDNGITWTDMTGDVWKSGGHGLSYVAAYGWLYVGQNALANWKYSTNEGVTWQSTNITTTENALMSFTMKV